MAITPAAPAEPEPTPAADAEDFGRRTLIATGPIAPARPERAPARTPTAPDDFTPPATADVSEATESDLEVELDAEPAAPVAEPARVPPHTPPMAAAVPVAAPAPAGAVPSAPVREPSPAELSQPRGSVAEVAAPIAPPTSLVPPEKKKRSRIGLFLLIGLLLVAGGLVGAAFVLTGDPNPIPFIQSLLEP